jgi:DNA-binding response OmpR family regulator
MEKNEYDIILADLMMPGKNGRAFLKELREKGDKTPVIFISGKLDVTREEMIELGAVDFIRKPYDIESIKTVLQRLFSPTSLS